MRSAFSAQSSRHIRRNLCGAIFVVMLLASCRLTVGARPTAAARIAYAPRFDPTPTIHIVSSDELYGEDSRAVGETSPGLASFPVGAVLPPAPDADSEHGVTVLLDAATSIRGELYLADGPRNPGLLLLGEDARAWGNLPSRLSQAGYVALVLETEATTRARHVETMLQSLIAVSNVDAGLIAVVGAGRAADLALLACAVNSLCDALALLSPLSRDTLLNVLPSYGERPLWLAAANADAEARRAAAALAEAARGEARFLAVPGGRGALMLQLQPELEEDLLLWLADQLDTG
ncbi:MAG: hypothetical protein OXG78_07750 [Chloroflexi bacterium]|nr:hypothetical protein [Chloroflexota bacterium]